MSQITLNTLTPQQLTLNISAQQFSFADTSELIFADNKSAQYQAWIAQFEAKKAAEFGLSIKQAGFNLMALGEPGTGRTSLMLSAMFEAAANQPLPQDLIALYQFDVSGKPFFIRLPAGAGTQLKLALDQFVRNLAKELANLLEAKVKENALTPIQAFLDVQISLIKTNIESVILESETKLTLKNYFELLQKDVLDYLELWQPNTSGDGENNIDSLLSESFFGRYRVNVLVEHQLAEQSVQLVHILRQ